MDILMKYAKKKTVFILSTVLSGIVTLLYLISKFGPTTSSNVNINDINELAGTIGSMVTIIQIIFYLFIILAIVTAILSGVYFFKKNKQEYVMLGEFIVSCINSILLLLSMSGINAICKILRVAISGDYSSLMTMNSARLLSSVTSAASNLKYFMYLSIFVFIINIVLLLIVKKIINIDGFHFNFDEPVVTAVPAQEPVHEDSTTVEDDSTIADNELTQENGETETNTVEPNASETKPATINTQKIKDFFKTKNGKITIGVAAALIVCFGGYKIYDTFFNYTSIDLGKNITVEFTGKDGSGYIKDVESNIDYDKNNSDLSNFVSSTYTDYDFSGDLSNGDKITVTIKYSEELAKANKIKVTNDSKTFTVKGLIEKFKDSSKIPEKVKESPSRQRTDTQRISNQRRKQQSHHHAQQRCTYRYGQRLINPFILKSHDIIFQSKLSRIKPDPAFQEIPSGIEGCHQHIPERIKRCQSEQTQNRIIKNLEYFLPLSFLHPSLSFTTDPLLHISLSNDSSS